MSRYEADRMVPGLGEGSPTEFDVLALVRDAVAVAERPRGGGSPHIRYANAAWLDLVGRAREEVVGSPLALLEPTEAESGELHRLVDTAEADESVHGLAAIVRGDQTRGWVEADVTARRRQPGSWPSLVVVLRDVTERVRRDRLMALGGWRAHDLLAVVDSRGVVVRVEPRHQRVLGHGGDEVAGSVLADMAHPGDADTLSSVLANPTAAGGGGMARLRHRDGSWRWLELHVEDHRRDPDVGGVVVAGRDASGRQHAQAELARTVGQLRMAVDVAGLGTWQLDVAHGTLTQDAHAATQFAVDPDGPPLTLEDGLAHVHRDDREALRHAITDAVANDRSFERTFRVDVGEGWRWLLARGTPMHANDDAVTHVNGITLDITGRHDVAEQVTRALEAFTDAYFLLDRQWRFAFLNASAEQLLDASRNELIGRSVWQALPDQVATVSERGYQRAAATGEAVAFQAFYPPNGCWYEVRVLPGDDGLAVLFRNVTDRMRAEAEHHRLLAGERAARAAADDARRAAEATHVELAHAASHDALTGLVNRTELERHLTAVLAADPTSVTVLLFDLDDFKSVNNSLGHAFGDMLLCYIAARLVGNSPPSAMVCRLGGDKFIVACDDGDVDDAVALADRLLLGLNDTYSVDERDIALTASVGVASATPDDTADTVIRNAATAMSSAKRGGRGRIGTYDRRLHQDELRRLNVANELRTACDGEQFELEYQPIFDLAHGHRVGAEALLRWNHPTRGRLAPGGFIDVAEDTGLIVPIGSWVIDQACRIIADRRVESRPTVWVNVAAPQLVQPDFVTTVANAQHRHGIGDGELGIELTERALISDPEAGAAQLAAVHDLGVRVALDDFGTGYSSMSSLQHYPIDVLKIDRAFTSRVATRDGDAIVRAIVALAHALGAAASAEGIETQEQLDAIRATDCDTAAGYLLARPQASDSVLPDHHGK